MNLSVLLINNINKRKGINKMYNFKKDIGKKTFAQKFDKPIDKLKKIGKNTFEYEIDGVLKIRLYDTDIIEFIDNKTILNTGGYYTNTTKKRMNDFLSIGHVRQHKNDWYYYCNGIEERYFDGMQIDNLTGKILNKEEAPFFNEIDNHNKEINKKIKAYCQEINKNDLPDDSNGDCLFCTAPSLSNDTEHLLLHLEEKYIMKSLIINSLYEAGYDNPDYVYTIYKASEDKPMITKSVTKYFRKALLKR